MGEEEKILILIEVDKDKGGGDQQRWIKNSLMWILLICPLENWVLWVCYSVLWVV